MGDVQPSLQSRIALLKAVTGFQAVTQELDFAANRTRLVAVGAPVERQSGLRALAIELHVPLDQGRETST